ncbi:TetR/AcrR family transcriptional regulator [Paraburkholderia acidisoli]|uniref:TetR family transcriptional regulator n=1 Tax=Paraburkholderia acidisoli TaxID=2571748 RepID=A0A7Z2JFE0_9BURK|nr:TetR/AcrR family transcriptional regulator [Paraburkholderia acidisoli]QGZ63337.1 TetR family transcriptional regulator [Paraburkholderia acidisoli]
MGERLQKTQKSQQRREDILACARELFERKGFANTSINDIAQACGIKRENVYYYYPSRGDILIELVRPNNQVLVDGMERILAANVTPVTRLFLALQHHIRLFDRVALDTVTVGLRGIAHDDRQSVHKEVRPLYKRYEDCWVQLIEEGAQAGVLRTMDNPKLVVFAILGMCNWLTHWYDPAGPVSLDGIVDVFFNLIAGGLVDASRLKTAIGKELANLPPTLLATAHGAASA